MKKKVIFMAIILILIPCAVILINEKAKEQDGILDTIVSQVNGKGGFTDYFGDIGVGEASDVKFSIDDKKGDLLIHFGELDIEYPIEDLQEKELLDKFRTIGITFKRNAKGDLKVFYLGIEVGQTSR